MVQLQVTVQASWHSDLYRHYCRYRQLFFAYATLRGFKYPLTWMSYIGLVSLIEIEIGWSEHRGYLRLHADLAGRSNKPSLQATRMQKKPSLNHED